MGSYLIARHRGDKSNKPVTIGKYLILRHRSKEHTGSYFFFE